MAKGGERWDNEFCAAHGGEIPGFSRLSMRINEIDQYRDLFRREVVDYRKISTLTGFVVGGAAVVGPLAFAAAPAVGGAIGVQLGLTGAAATNAGLATLGLGSLAAGGYGIAGGIAVVTAMGAATGGVLSGVIANAYFGAIKGFRIVRLKKGDMPAVLVINGFLTEDKVPLERDWLDTLGKFYPGNSWYLVEWESQRLRRLGSLFAKGAGKEALRVSLKRAASSASKKAATKINPLNWVLTLAGLLKNDWHVAMVKAAQAGVLLADILARTSDNQTFILMGHSLGARVIYYSMSSLAGRRVPKLYSAQLLGGAVGNRPTKDWENAAMAASRPVHNYYSGNDWVLKYLYSIGTGLIGSPAIGSEPIGIQDRLIQDSDVTQLVKNHSDFKRMADRFLAST